MRIASFDMGRKNFAFCVEEVDEAELCAASALLPGARARYGSDGRATPAMAAVLGAVYRSGRVLLLDNVDLTAGEQVVSRSEVDPVVFVNMTKVLDQHADHWAACDLILLEQQMHFGRRQNHVAVKLAQHCYSYFSFQFGLFKEVVNYPAYHKTRVLGAPKKMTKSQRKRWAVEEARAVLAAQEDHDALALLLSRKKQDDLADVLVQLQSFKVRHLDKVKVTE